GPEPHPESARPLARTLQQLRLADAWRLQNPTKRQYTWCRGSPQGGEATLHAARRGAERGARNPTWSGRRKGPPSGSFSQRLKGRRPWISPARRTCRGALAAEASATPGGAARPRARRTLLHPCRCAPSSSSGNKNSSSSNHCHNSNNRKNSSSSSNHCHNGNNRKNSSSSSNHCHNSNNNNYSDSSNSGRNTLTLHLIAQSQSLKATMTAS
ncbi:unnamed protein product, partial [Lampetra fluviatilis]